MNAVDLRKRVVAELHAVAEREFIGRETSHFEPKALLTCRTPAGEYSMPRWKRLVWIVLVNRQQAAFAAAPNKDHGAARAFALPACALERREAVGECLAQIGARRQFGCVEHVVEHVAEHEPAGEAGRGQGVVLASFGCHVRTVTSVVRGRPFSSPRRSGLYGVEMEGEEGVLSARRRAQFPS